MHHNTSALTRIRQWTAGALGAAVLAGGAVGLHLATTNTTGDQSAATGVTTGTDDTAVSSSSVSGSTSSGTFAQVAPVTNANSGPQANTAAS